MKNNIIITSAGRRVELVKSFQSELKSIFLNAKLYTTDMEPSLSSACMCSDGFWKTPYVNDDSYIETLLQICIENDIGMVIPTIDTELEVLSENINLFENKGIFVIISSKVLIDNCRDKRKTGGLFESLGINYPEIFDRENLSFPCLVKPYDGSCSLGVNIINSKSNLDPDILNDEKMMFMELIGEQYTEYTVDVYYSREGSLKCMVPRERIEVRSGEVSKGVTRKGDIYDFLLPKLNKINGAKGCLNIQIFADINKRSFYGLEVNPRFGGGYPLTHSSGGNYIKWLLKEYFLSEDVQFFDQWESDLLMLRYDAKELTHGYK
jgi:carbamoyl-phosphate synthase large subunit